MSNIYLFSWNKDSFSSKLYLVLDAYANSLLAWLEWLVEFSPEGSGLIHRINRLKYMSALSSSLYGVAATAKTKFSSRKPWTYHWLLLGAGFYRAVAVSDKMVELAKEWGIELSADQLDIRQSILRKARRLDDAMECIDEALLVAKDPSMTRCLLLIGMADIHSIQMKTLHSTRERTLEFLDEAIQSLVELRMSCNPEHGQMARFHRAAGVVERRLGNEEDAQVHFATALEIAVENRVLDQVAKIRVEMDAR